MRRKNANHPGEFVVSLEISFSTGVGVMINFRTGRVESTPKISEHYNLCYNIIY